MRHVPSSLVALVVIAAAAPAVRAAPRRLTRDEIVRAGEAAAKRLPPVDKARAKTCSAQLSAVSDPSKPGYGAPALLGVAGCFRQAGSLGAAITIWNAVVQRFPRAPEAAEATHRLGPAYEDAGLYSQAAHWDDTYARKYAGEHDARALEVRAICLWRQLGVDDEADRATRYLAHAWRLPKVDPATICDGVAPIVVPPPPAAPPSAPAPAPPAPSHGAARHAP